MKRRPQSASLRVVRAEEAAAPTGISKALLLVLDDALTALERAKIPHVVGGGLAAWAFGIRETTDDIDVFVEPPMAPVASRALRSAGFQTWVEDPPWLHKALKNGIEVDTIYESGGTFHLDEEAFQRAVAVNLGGRHTTVLSLEDFFVMKAQVATPVTPRHWNDAVNILRRYALDWEYVVRRSRGRPRKVLKALLLGHEEGVVIPAWVFATLMEPVIGLPR